MMATREQIATLRWFRWHEFKRPHMMDWSFLQWLDQVRGMAGVPFELTSDGRLDVPPGGSPTSLHLQGRAVDFRWDKHTAEDRARIIRAITHTPVPSDSGGYELGLEPNAQGGPHWHLGLLPPGRHSRVFVK